MISLPLALANGKLYNYFISFKNKYFNLWKWNSDFKYL